MHPNSLRKEVRRAHVRGKGSAFLAAGGASIDEMLWTLGPAAKPAASPPTPDDRYAQTPVK